MKIRITVQNVNTQHEWTEDYDRLHVNNQKEAEVWAHSLIKNFNDTCRPGESKRCLVKTELVGMSTAHDWFKRTDGMSVRFRGRTVDIFECRKCGIRGKKYGLLGNLVRDSKYKAKKYEICDHNRDRSKDSF